MIILSLLTLFLCGCEKKNEDPPQQQQPPPAAITPTKEVTVSKDADGKYWYVDADGNRFLSLGINNILPAAWNPVEGTDYYNAVEDVFGGDYDAWKDDVVGILSGYGFNTIGAWSHGGLTSNEMYETVCLYVASHNADRCLDGLRPGFEQRVCDNVNRILADHPDISRLMGVFLDNEAAWFGKDKWDDIATYTLLELAIDLPAGDGANTAAKEFIKGRYDSVKAFSEAWGKPIDSWASLDTNFMRRCLNEQTQIDRDSFTELAAEAYFDISTKVVRQMLPGKLILGVRFAARAPEPVMAVCGKYCDVVSVNDYRRYPQASEEMLTEYYVRGGKPLMITEFSWRGEENSSGNPNIGGAGVVVKTQAQRGANYQAYVEDLLSYPMVIGAHWFEFADQSPQGRFDGENSNYGIVDIRHRPYTEVLSVMKETNARIARVHADSERKAPTELIKRNAVIFTPGQHPERPPFVDLITETPVIGHELFNAPDASVSLKKDADTLVFDYDTGDQWGCGVIFHGPAKWAVGHGPEHATNIDGYSVLVIEAEMSEDINFEIFADEAGVADQTSENFDFMAGDDGESFTSGTMPGKVGQHEYLLELKDLKPRVDWGNQSGQRRVDMYAMKGFVICLHGGQGSGNIRIHSIKLTR